MTRPDAAGNVTLVGTTVADVVMVYIDVLIGDVTGTISVDTAVAVVVMTEDDVVVNDVVDDSDTVVRPTVADSAYKRYRQM